MTYNDITRNERTLSGVLAFVMHALFFALIVFGVSWQHTRTTSAFVVDLWRDLPPVKKPKVKPLPPPKVKPAPEPPKPVPKVEPKPEPKPEVKPDIALKEKLEKERRQKEELERRKELEKKKEQEKIAARKREEAEKKKKEEAALKAKRAKEEAERRAQAQQDQALRQLLQQQAARADAQARLMDEYVNRIRDKIRRYVVLPPNLQGNPEAQFDVVQIPGGEVLSVKLKRSSGVAAYDSAVERAILKAQPLPPPPSGVTFGDVRELVIKFRPKE